jgi:hypothetical protein
MAMITQIADKCKGLWPRPGVSLCEQVRWRRLFARACGNLESATAGDCSFPAFVLNYQSTTNRESCLALS